MVNGEHPVDEISIKILSVFNSFFMGEVYYVPFPCAILLIICDFYVLRPTSLSHCVVLFYGL